MALDEDFRGNKCQKFGTDNAILSAPRKLGSGKVPRYLIRTEVWISAECAYSSTPL